MTTHSFSARYFGFIPHSDWSKAQAPFHSDMKKSGSKIVFILAAKLDIQAAYDSVWRDGFMYKLANVGIGGKTALWIANWLSNRTIKIKWQGTFSGPAPSYRGVPQGSVLSPILFMIYLWDIFEAVDSGVHIIVYADDIILYVSDQCMDIAHRKLQDILDRISMVQILEARNSVG